MVIQGNGSLEFFNMIAPSIIDDPAIFNVLAAPDGIASHVYPLEGNEAVIGLNFFGEGAGNREAIAARDSGRLILGGPFELIQGGQALVGRLPVYIDSETERRQFWGLVSVSLRFPDVLESADLGLLKDRGFAYELWRISPDTNERQIISSNYDNMKAKTSFIEKHVPVINADWYLKVWSMRMWYSYPENLILVFAGLLISLLVFFVMQNNSSLKKIKLVLENIAQSDPLTGIYNRRHFMEIAGMIIEKSRRMNKNDGYIVLLDLDRFKNVNDKYGHVIGDKVLIELVSRIKATIRPYDLFARYGGEEFIIFATDIDLGSMTEMAERLRLSICGSKFEFGSIAITVTASFGIAFLEDNNMEDAILNADKALYAAKEAGRNKVLFFKDAMR